MCTDNTCNHQLFIINTVGYVVVSPFGLLAIAAAD
jgi:hypothetical protein